jgi:hypothetical protein
MSVSSLILGINLGREKYRLKVRILIDGCFNQ